MKTTLLILALAIAPFAAAPLRAADPAPLIAAPAAPSVADQQAAAAVRINQQITQLQAAIKYAVNSIDREINHNRDKLTAEQVLAGLGADKAASLAQARADLVALANKYAPGTFPQ